MTGVRGKMLNASLPVSAFFAAALGIYLRPEAFLYFFPLFSLVFLWYSRRRERETRFIVLFILSAFGFIFPKFSDAFSDISASFLVYAEVFAMWVYAYGADYLARGNEKEMSRKLKALSAAYAGIKNLEEETARYSAHKEGIARKISFRSGLAEAIEDISVSGTAEEIKVKMEGLLKKHFPDCGVSSGTGGPADGFERWVFERKTPLLVKDIDSDSRFPGIGGAEFKSLMVVPVYFFSSVTGFVRIFSRSPGRLGYEDLQIAELIANICSASMENISLYGRVKELAIKDGLTGLFTHRAFQERLEEEILRAARTRESFSLIMADIDHFKKYNDVYGHQAGDEVLRSVAGVLSGSIREIDFAARYGGEEFAVILTAVGKKDAVEMAEYLRAKIASLGFSFGGKSVGITASFGVSEFPSDATIASQVLRFADERLYRAKKGGRNRVVYE